MSRRDRNVFTIMIVPHAETKVFTFRLSTLAFQGICYILVCLFLFMMILARQYQTMLSNMWELEELRLVNREQRDQIEQLVEEAQALQQKMVILDELDKQVREMMELQSIGGHKPSSVLPTVPEGTSSPTATVASFTGIGGPLASGGSGVLPRTGGLASVSREKIRQALSALNVYNQLQGEATARSESLSEVWQAMANSEAFMSAKPSIWPAFGYISSGYGYRRTIFGAGQHGGFDIAALYGVPVVATADGTVIYAGWDGSYGNMVEIEHSYGWSTIYGHCSKLVVDVGDRVKRGEVVGFVGSTGKSTGPHVHYEVRVNGRTVNPRYYLRGKG